MKQYILNTLLAGGLALHAGGSVVFSDAFNYADGLISQDSASPWTTHGGTANQVEVSHGVLQLSQSKSEDISAALSGGPYRSGSLFISSVVNMTAPPSGDGTFFLHLKDAASSFKARVYATTNGVSAGRYRLGIANGTGSPIYIAADLDLTRSYRIVARYNAAAPTSSTLWIDPASETSTALRADATDSSTASSITSIALRQSLSAGDGMGTLLLDDLAVGTAFTDVAGANTPPTLTRIPDLDLGMDEISPLIPFTLNDRETAPELLIVNVQSSNAGLISVKGISLRGSGSTRSLQFQPTLGQQGTARLTVTVSDGVNSASSTFGVMVGAPTISRIDSVEFPQDAISPPVLFTIKDRETPADLLQVTAFASNTNLFSRDSLRWEGSGSNRALRLHPLAGRSGISTLQVVVSDGLLSATNSFVATVFPSLGVLMQDHFDRPDGPMSGGASPWLFHAPDAPDPNHLTLKSGWGVLSDAFGEDAHAAFSGGTIAANSGAILYAGAKVKLRRLPSSAGNFFLHFRDENNGFRGRLHVLASGSPAGHCRFAVSAGAETPSVHPLSIAPDEEHFLVLRYSVSSGTAQLWVDPTSESDPFVKAMESATALALSNLSLRQADGIGELLLDDLTVATQFSDVMPSMEAPRLRHDISGSTLRLEWPEGGGYRLQQSTTLRDAAWDDVKASVSAVNGNLRVELPMASRQSYFRLIR